jgi:prefoldin alpha subunit
MTEFDKDQMKALEMQLMNHNLTNLRNQLASLSQQVLELEDLRNGLSSLKDIEDKKSFVPFGSGIFLEAELKKPKDVLMNVGTGVLVKKDFNTALDIIGKQITELNKISFEMSSELEKIESQLNSQ